MVAAKAASRGTWPRAAIASRASTSSPRSFERPRRAYADRRYVLDDAAASPFQDASFDLVVAYNSLMDIRDTPAAVREAARVLGPVGRFCACVTHPIADARRFAAREADERFVIEGSYLGRRRLEATFERNGLPMTFRGWTQALEDYSRALEEAGVLLEALREPPLPAEEPPVVHTASRTAAAANPCSMPHGRAGSRSGPGSRLGTRPGSRSG